jgi:hypothetical protein
MAKVEVRSTPSGAVTTGKLLYRQSIGQTRGYSTAGQLPKQPEIALFKSAPISMKKPANCSSRYAQHDGILQVDLNCKIKANIPDARPTQSPEIKDHLLSKLFPNSNPFWQT